MDNNIYFSLIEFLWELNNNAKRAPGPVPGTLQELRDINSYISYYIPQ